MSFPDFSLLPADDPQSTPEQDLQSAVAGALAIADVPTPIDETPAAPFGRSWRFDWETGQFVREGQSPADTSGFGAMEEWCQMSLHSARFAHAAFSDDFGMEYPDSVVGEFAVGETIADFERHMIEALLVHDRVSSIENVELRWEPGEGVLYIDQFDVVTDQDERITVSDVALTVGGGS